MMRRLLILLLFTLPSFAAVAWVRTNGTDSVSTAASPQSLTLTTASTAGNTLVVTFSWKSSARRVQFVCSGAACTNSTTTGCMFFPYTWGQPNSGATVASQIWIGFNCVGSVSTIVAGFMVDSTGANGTAIADWAVNEYSGVNSIGQVVHATGSSTSPSVSITMQDSGNMLVMGSASLGSLGVPTSNTGNLRSALRNGSTSSFDAVAACDNTAASGSAATCTVTITSGAWVAQGVELRTGEVTNALPNHVQSFGTNLAGNDASTPTTIFTPLTGDAALGTNGTTSTYNTVVCVGQWNHTVGLTVTVTTNNTWQGSTVDTLSQAVLSDDASHSTTGLFYGTVTPGVKYLTWTFSAALGANVPFFSACTQFNHLKANTAPTATCGQTGQGEGTLTCGSMTLGASCASGCLVFYASAPDANGGSIGNGTGYCAAGSGYITLLASASGGYCTTYQIISSSGATNPSNYVPFDTVSGNTNTNVSLFNTIGASFIIDNSQGTTPTGIRIARTMKYELGANIQAYIYSNCAGGVGDFNEVDMDQTGTGNTFTVFDTNQVVYSLNNAGSTSNQQMRYSVNATLDSSSACKIVQSAGTNNNSIIFRDITGVATSNPFDTMSTTCPSPSTYGATGCANQQATVGPGSVNNAPNVQPSAANELVIVENELGTGPVSNLTAPSGSVIDLPYWTGISDSNPIINGNFQSHFMTTSGAALNWTMNQINATSNGGTAWVLLPLPQVNSGGINKKAKLDKLSQ